jgi:hypothetical protein
MKQSKRLARGDFVDVEEVPNLWSHPFPIVERLAYARAERARSGCRSFSGLIKFAENSSFAFHGNFATD